MLKRHREPRRGHTLVLVVLCLIRIMGVVAVVVEGGLLLSDYRRVQRAAESAALAAATDLFTNANTHGGTDPQGTAKKSALTTAAANGFADDGTNSTVTVNIPPKSGTFSGQKGFAEVLVTYNEPRLFSRLWASGTVQVSARTVARGTYQPASPGI